MVPDPNDEIRAIRDKLSAACEYDIDRIFEETVRQQTLSGRSFLSPPEYVQERRATLLRGQTSGEVRTSTTAES
ncbi:MAG TPA: hypothetical protein VGN57_06410 [Pirellulaceae bacterium]|nr:hypothetical protein [Pirellulaceae bacterium]